MRGRVAFAFASLLISSCTVRRGVDPNAARDALLQAMSAQGLQYAQITSEPRFREAGNEEYMECTVQFLSIYTVSSRSAVAKFEKGANGWKMIDYTLAPESSFTQKTAQVLP